MTTKTPLFDRLVMGLASLYYRKDRADVQEIWKRAGWHANPPPVFEEFAGGGMDIWDIAFINGSSRVAPSPHGEAGDVVLEDGLLKLRVRNDPNFGRKSSKWRKEVPAAEQYNNAYVVGMGGFLPTPGQTVSFECRMRISAGFHGSTGIWVQEANTFDPKTGIMIKPFRSFGFSYLGESSDPYIRGLAIETVIGLSIQNKQTIGDVDVSAWHTYGMKWSWSKQDSQHIAFFIDERNVGNFHMHPFGPAEIQLWADNYQIGRGLKIGYLNVPDKDESMYDWIRITPADD